MKEIYICDQIKAETLAKSNTQIISDWKDVFKLTDQERIQAGLKLASHILDNHAENTETDKACRNIARAFLDVLADEEVEFE